MNNLLNEYFQFNFELNFEWNRFLARDKVKMNTQKVSATHMAIPHNHRAPQRHRRQWHCTSGWKGSWHTPQCTCSEQNGEKKKRVKR